MVEGRAGRSNQCSSGFRRRSRCSRSISAHLGDNDLVRLLALQSDGQPVLVAPVIKGILFLPAWKKSTRSYLQREAIGPDLRFEIII